MVEQARLAISISIVARSFVVGDKWLDVELATNAGARGILVRTGLRRWRCGRAGPTTPLAIVDTLLDAARWILRHAPRRAASSSRCPHRDRAHRSTGRLLALMQAFRGRRVAVVGDLIADEFIYGRVERVSREAPVLILSTIDRSSCRAAPGNAANNAAALGGDVRARGLVGQDEPGSGWWRPAARRRSDGDGPAGGYDTPVKTRILAGGMHSAKQQVVRIDRVTVDDAERAARRSFVRPALDAAAGADAVLISDYGSGLVTPELVAAIAARARAGRPRPRAGAAGFALRAAALSRPHGLHAERIGGRAAARLTHRR